jgi:hypothetical protein
MSVTLLSGRQWLLANTHILLIVSRSMIAVLFAGEIKKVFTFLACLIHKTTTTTT